MALGCVLYAIGIVVPHQFLNGGVIHFHYLPELNRMPRAIDAFIVVSDTLEVVGQRMGNEPVRQKPSLFHIDITCRSRRFSLPLILLFMVVLGRKMAVNGHGFSQAYPQNQHIT